VSPLVSHVYDLGLIKAEAMTQRECVAADVRFARAEGIVPAPEPTHALAARIDEALQCKETGESKVIFTALRARALDLAAYGAYLSNTLVDHELSADEPREPVGQLPPAPA
jgi:tryptophan synthase beta chain